MSGKCIGKVENFEGMRRSERNFFFYIRKKRQRKREGGKYKEEERKREILGTQISQKCNNGIAPHTGGAGRQAVNNIELFFFLN